MKNQNTSIEMEKLLKNFNFGPEATNGQGCHDNESLNVSTIINSRYVRHGERLE
jgi:hypothetical protein